MPPERPAIEAADRPLCNAAHAIGELVDSIGRCTRAELHEAQCTRLEQHADPVAQLEAADKRPAIRERAAIRRAACPLRIDTDSRGSEAPGFR